MKTEFIRSRVIEIEMIARSGDFEAAHAMEDDIHQAALMKISRMRNASAMRELAREVLKTRQISFPRYAA